MGKICPSIKGQRERKGALVTNGLTDTSLQNLLLTCKLDQTYARNLLLEKLSVVRMRFSFFNSKFILLSSDIIATNQINKAIVVNLTRAPVLEVMYNEFP